MATQPESSLTEAPTAAARGRLRVLLAATTPENPNQGVSREYHLTATALERRGHRAELVHVTPAESPLPMPGPIARGGAVASKLLTLTVGDIRRRADHADVVQVSSGDGALLFRQIRRSLGFNRPLLVTELPGLSRFDYEALMLEHLRGHTRVSRRYRWFRAPAELGIERVSIRYADLVLVHNQRDLEWIVANRWKSEEEVREVPLPVHPALVSRVAVAVPARDYPPRGARFLFMGSWLPRKGVHYIPQAFLQVHEMFPDATLTIAGAYHLSPQTILRDFDAHCRQRVRISPFLSLDEHRQLLTNHDIFISPSLSEGYGLALLEAMAAGLPVITTPTGLAAGSLEHNGPFSYVPPGTSQGLAKVMSSLVSDVERRRSLGRRAFQFARSRTVERLGAELERHYCDGLDRIAGL